MSKIPSTGNIQFLSNANSVSQVFSLGAAPVSTASLLGKNYRKTRADNSNWVEGFTIARNISLRNLAGGFIGTIAAPDINAYGVKTDQTLEISRNTFDSGDGNESNGYVPTTDQYVGVGTSPGADNVMRYARYGFFEFQAGVNPGTTYYVSAFTSNHVTGEKGLLYVSGGISGTNP
jgi:hypothetical protein